MKNLLRSYVELEQKIHDYFGYVEDWRCIPLRDQTDDYWMLLEKGDGSGTVVWSHEPFTEESVIQGRTIYNAVIYTQRHLPRWVYHANGYTMISIDTRQDRNEFLAVFDDSKRYVDKELSDLYQQTWGSFT